MISYISSTSMAEIISRTLGRVDMRLVDHGKRVAYLVMKILQIERKYDDQTIRDLCILAMLHDIGAYKTEEIDNMVSFETKNVWQHSIYGYLFIKQLSPLAQYAPVVLFHHTDYERMEKMDVPHKRFAQILSLADRTDVYIMEEHKKPLDGHIQKYSGTRFSEEIMDLFFEAELHFHVIEHLKSGDYWEELVQILDKVPFTIDEIDTYLKMIVYAIDFRSQYTVIHTITTTKISLELARLFQMEPEEVKDIHYGALLHDLGKIGIPVEILEFPGKLSPQAMNVMQTHVDITEEILKGQIDDKTLRIALRHHEKLDGSGYPRGLSGDLLTLGEKIVAVADIVSALSGVRSYKGEFDKAKSIGILSDMQASGKLDPKVVGMMLEHYDEIMENVSASTRPVLNVYNNISVEYDRMMEAHRLM